MVILMKKEKEDNRGYSESEFLFVKIYVSV